MREIFANVRVFDGGRLMDRTHDVVLDGGVIAAVVPAGTAGREGASILDGSGAVLLPGLIDAHVHLRGIGDLEELARWGVTTALDMGSWPPALIAELRSAGSTDVRSTGPCRPPTRRARRPASRLRRCRAADFGVRRPAAGEDDRRRETGVRCFTGRLFTGPL